MPSCKSLTALAKACGKVQGGATNELYLIAYDDLTLTNGKAYTEDATNSMISAFGLGTEKFVKVGVINNSIALNSDYSNTPENNSFSFDSTLAFNISNITAESRKFMQDLAEADFVVAVIKLKSGRVVAVGADGYLTLGTASMQSGTQAGDLNGFTVSLTETGGVSFPKLVDPTLLSTIV